MNEQLMVALLSGGFALAGGLGGVALSGSVTRRAEDRRVKTEDDRRWLTDRRTAYSTYLTLTDSMLRQIDGVAVFLSYDGSEAVSGEDEAHLTEDLYDYFERWNDELQPALGEVELLATPNVAELADRMSTALMEVTAYVERRDSFTSYHPTWFQAKDMWEVLRNAMRLELGLEATELARGRTDPDWPWLPDRPQREAYVQDHTAPEQQVNK